MSGGRSDQLSQGGALLDLTNRVRALEATPTFFLTVTGPFILMRASLAAVPNNTPTPVPFTEVFAAGSDGGANSSIPSPYADAHYSWDAGADAHLVNVLTIGTYIVGLQAWFGSDGAFPTNDFNAYVRKTGLGGGLYATQQPSILCQQKFYSAFNFAPTSPFDNAGIDYTKPFLFTSAQITTGVSFGIEIGHDHPTALDCIASLFIVKASDD